MHGRRLIELGARIALTAPRHVRRAARFSPTGCHEYWLASRDRFDAWSRALDPFTPARVGERISRVQWNGTLRPLLEDIFTGELLVRIWTAVAIAHTREHRQADVEPTLRRVLLNHLEIRNRALNCVVFGSGPESKQIVGLQQTRRRIERWIDMLFGEMQRSIEVAEFSHDPRRTRDFARMTSGPVASDAAPASTGVADATEERGQEGAMLDSLREAFAGTLSFQELFPDLNQRIATAILSCFQGDWLDAIEWSQDHWRSRLHAASNDTLLWIDDLLNMDAPRTPRKRGRKDGESGTKPSDPN